MLPFEAGVVVRLQPAAVAGQLPRLRIVALVRVPAVGVLPLFEVLPVRVGHVVMRGLGDAGGLVAEEPGADRVDAGHFIAAPR